MKPKTREIILSVVIFILGVACLMGEPIYRSFTKRRPTIATTYSFTDWSDTRALAMVDLHVNDLVTYEISHMDGWIDVWIDNAYGEPMTPVSTSGRTELVIPEQGDYILRIEGDHANASVMLAIYTDE